MGPPVDRKEGVKTTPLAYQCGGMCGTQGSRAVRPIVGGLMIAAGWVEL